MEPLNTTGIHLKFDASNGWTARVEFSTWEYTEETCTEGSIGPSYSGDLAKVIDMAKQAADTIGVVFAFDSSLYVPGDSEGAPSADLPPDWRGMIAEQCKRLGWRDVYREGGLEFDVDPSQFY